MGALDRLITWGAENCEADGPIWRCLVRSSFTPVGSAIPGPGETVPPEGEAATPEEAVAGDASGERVEASRTDDAVVFAWLDEQGLAIRSEVAERGPDGWGGGTTTECSDGSGHSGTGTLEPIPAPIDAGDLTVPSPTPS